MIEIDGDSHAPSDKSEYDAERTQCLQEHGYRVIRPAAAQQVEEDLAGVVCPSRSLSPSFGFAQDKACQGARDAPGT